MNPQSPPKYEKGLALWPYLAWWLKEEKSKAFQYEGEHWEAGKDWVFGRKKDIRVDFNTMLKLISFYREKSITLVELVNQIATWVRCYHTIYYIDYEDGCIRSF